MMGNPWPSGRDKRMATEAARGDNAKIAALADQVARFQRYDPCGSWPSVPPVEPPTDASGAVINLDTEVLVNRHCRMGTAPGRGKVVAIGHGGHPGRMIINIRPHGSNYLSGSSLGNIEVHAFDEYQWLRAEEAAAKVMARRNIDLAECLWGHFYFEPFQSEAARQYVARLDIEGRVYLKESS